MNEQRPRVPEHSEHGAVLFLAHAVGQAVAYVRSLPVLALPCGAAGGNTRGSEPERDAQGVWRMETVEVPQALEQVEPALREPVKRLLSVRPEKRGTVAQLAEEGT